MPKTEEEKIALQNVYLYTFYIHRVLEFSFFFFGWVLSEWNSITPLHGFQIFLLGSSPQEFP